jgi:hypothetical protein
MLDGEVDDDVIAIIERAAARDANPAATRRTIYVRNIKSCLLIVVAVAFVCVIFIAISQSHARGSQNRDVAPPPGNGTYLDYY